MCGKALAAVINNHTEPMELWDWSLKVSKDTSFSLIWARILQGKTSEVQTVEDPMLPVGHSLSLPPSH